MSVIQWNQNCQNFLTLQPHSSRRTSLKQNLFSNNSIFEAILISNDFIVTLDKNVSKMCLSLTYRNAIKLFCLRFKCSDVFLSCISILITYSTRNFIQDNPYSLIPLISSVNVFTYTEKGGSVKSSKQNFHFIHAFNFHNLISISFRNPHSFYL